MPPLAHAVKYSSDYPSLCSHHKQYLFYYVVYSLLDNFQELMFKSLNCLSCKNHALTRGVCAIKHYDPLQGDFILYYKFPGFTNHTFKMFIRVRILFRGDNNL